MSVWELKPPDPIGKEHMLQEEIQALHGRICNQYDYHQWWEPGTMSLKEIYLVHQISKGP